MDRRIIISVVFIALAITAMGILGRHSPQEDTANDQPTQPDDQTQTQETSSKPEIFYISNQGTGSRREEIYRMLYDGSGITRVTDTDYHHFLVGSSSDGRYIVTTRAINDTSARASVQRIERACGDWTRRQVRS